MSPCGPTPRVALENNMAAIIMIGLLYLTVQAPEAPTAVSRPQTGMWRAWLDSPGGELPFGLELARGVDGWRGWLINGPERIEIPRVKVDGESVLFEIDHYDSRIRARLTPGGEGMHGMWSKQGAGSTQSKLPFHATAGSARRFAPRAENSPAGAIDGRWLVNFSSAEDPAVGIFETKSATGVLLGTFLTTTGDYRFLEGDWDGRRLRLSCFDGAHAFLFDAELGEDGNLAGDFWSRDSWHETWTARRDSNARLPDAFTQTKWTERVDLAALKFPDVDGKVRSLADAEFAGRARIIEVFGTWCPNCNDAVRYLVELHGKYKDHGLSIVGLAFEHTGNFERDARQVRRFAKRYDVEYPLLVAGLSDKEKASEAFPLLDRVRSYPTTIFLHADGRVRAIHTGYTGPATGLANYELRAKFESLIEELLAESNKSE